MLKLIAFDCFGTVFDMSGVSRDEIRDYVAHVNKSGFTPYKFPDSWYNLRAHPDSAYGIKLIQEIGIKCVALSNGSHELLKKISEENGIYWDHIVDLIAHKVYKPHQGAYKTIEADLGIKPEECLMVTANPTFGDIEGAKSIGMDALAIRGEQSITDIEHLYRLLTLFSIFG